MADVTPNIKKIALSDGDHYIDAKYLLDQTGNEKSYEDIVSLISIGLRTEVFDTVAKLPTLSEVSEARWKELRSTIALVPEGAGLVGTYAEYIVNGNNKATAVWEKIGTTATDLTNYQQIGKTLTSSGPSSNVTGETNIGDAVGTATVTYKKANANTGNAGAATTANTGASGDLGLTWATKDFKGTAATISVTGDVTAAGTVGSDGGAIVNGSNFSFTGEAKTVSVSGNYTPKGTISKPGVTLGTATTITYVTNASTNRTDSIGEHEHSLSLPTHGHGADVKAATITAYTAPSMTTISFTPNTLQSLTKTNYGFSSSTGVVTGATVNNSGVMSFNSATAGTSVVLSAGAQASLTGGVFSAGTLTYGSVTAAGSKSATTVTVTTGAAGAHYHSLFGGSASLATSSFVNYASAALSSTPTFYGEQGSVSASGSYTPAGTIGGTQTIGAHTHSFTGSAVTPILKGTYTPAGTLDLAAQAASHTHTYVALATHSHSVGSSDATATGSVSVAVGKHTHTLSNHTHNVTTAN